MGDDADTIGLLATFGRTTRIGPIGCNASLPELAARLGPPHDGGRVSDDNRWPHWFCYGSLQLVVCRCRLVSMVIVPVWHGSIKIPDARTGQPVSYPSEQVTYSAITAALDAAGCAWTPVTDIPGQCTVETYVDGIRTGFVFITTADGHFKGPPLAEPELDKVVSSFPDHDCPPLDPTQPDDGFGAG